MRGGLLGAECKLGQVGTLHKQALRIVLRAEAVAHVTLRFTVDTDPVRDSGDAGVSAASWGMIGCAIVCLLKAKLLLITAT